MVAQTGIQPFWQVAALAVLGLASHRTLANIFGGAWASWHLSGVELQLQLQLQTITR